MSLPLSAYDFFGYLACGVLVLCAVAVGTDHAWMLGQNQPASVILLGTVLAYIVGHAVAQLSSSILEHGLTRRFLGAPEKLLLHVGRPSGLWPRIFRGYSAPFPPELAARIREKATERAWGQDERTIFLRASTIVRRDPAIGGRLESFLNLYGFCRNCAMAMLLAALALAASARLAGDPSRLWLSAGSLATAIILFLRYLKFYRLYTHEVLLAAMEAA